MYYDEATSFNEPSGANATVINNLHSELRQRIDSLDSTISMLYSRVEPVLTPEAPTPPSAASPVAATPPQSMVADSLTQMCSHLLSLSVRLNSIIQRLEV